MKTQLATPNSMLNQKLSRNEHTIHYHYLYVTLLFVSCSHVHLGYVYRDDLDETVKDDEDEDSLACAPDSVSTPKSTPAAPPVKGDNEEDDGKLPFPTASEMNTRLRRIITTYQRDFKKQQLKQQQQAKVCIVWVLWYLLVSGWYYM